MVKIFKISKIYVHLALVIFLLTVNTSYIQSNTAYTPTDKRTENTETSKEFLNAAHLEKEIDLTEEEKAWLKAHPVIRVGSDPAWKPLEFVENNSEYQGIAIDYLNRIEMSLGVRFQFVRENWQDLIELAKNQKIDVFSCITKTPDRSEYLSFTAPYIEIPIGIFTREDIIFIADISDLTDKKVAVVGAYAIHELLAADYPDIKLITVPSIKEGLKLLDHKNVTAFIGNILTVRNEIRNNAYTNIRVSGETPYRNSLTIGIRKDWGMLQVIMQKAINAIPKGEKDYIYDKWVAAPIEEEWLFNYKNLLGFGIGIIIIITIILIWNYNLKISVNKKTKELNIYQNKLQDLVRDRTLELEKTNKELQKAKTTAENANLAKNKFILHMNHEFRTPLNAILGYSQILAKNDNIASLYKKQITAIAKNSNHLLTLINNVLKVAKIESGKIDIRKVSFNLRDLAEELLTFLRIKAEKKGLKLLLEKKINFERDLKSDPLLIREILINLLENAIKFTESGSIVLRIGTEKKEGKLRLLIDVEDTGPGIKKEMLTSIFNIFETTDTDEIKNEGAGLGLTISRQYARILGGDLRFSSTINSGSVFSLNIPVETDKTVIPEHNRNNVDSPSPEVDAKKNIRSSSGKSKLTGIHKIPKSLIKQLETATLNGEASQFKSLINEIKQFDAESGILIENLLDSYNYEAIINICKTL
ncbi:MAG: transporter substrate-binding domain-containing protein [Spirochaetales bacterium]|nr:transporter substrate-binding domain-containing protein [Spirochaetales bacterium]